MTYMQQFIEETQHERAMRRILACTHTLQSIYEELEDPGSVESRGDLVIAAENLLEIAIYVTDEARGIAWQYTPSQEELEQQQEQDEE